MARRWSKARLLSIALMSALALMLAVRHSTGTGRQVVLTTAGPAQQQWHNQPDIQHCQDSCFKARDGVCDEARGLQPAVNGGHSHEVHCGLGTDCQDCGPWTGVSPTSFTWLNTGLPSPEPVEWLRGQNESLRVVNTSTQPSFIMPITDASRDPDVSAMLHGYRHMTGGLTRIIHSMLSGSCINSSLPGGRALVAVVGANMGYTALYAAVMGCRVIAWEPVPLLRAYLAYGAAVNHVSHLIQIRPCAVSDLPPGSQVNLGVAKWGTYWGLASVNNLNLHPHEVRGSITAVTERLDDVIPAHTPVLLLKVDVEGYEPEVMSSAHRLVRTRQARHVLLEYSPGIAERHRDWSRLLRLSTMLDQLISAGYKLGHIPVFAFAAPWPPKDMSHWYAHPLPAVEEVGRQEVAADVQAAQLKLRIESNGSCEVHPSLTRFGVWKSCGEWTRTVHPKGFRSSHGYNTNLWASVTAEADTGNASKGAEGVLRLHGTAALFGRHEKLNGPGAKLWSSTRPGMGVGLIACDGIGKGHRLIHRCPCPDAQLCGEEEAALTALIQETGLFYKA